MRGRIKKRFKKRLLVFKCPLRGKKNELDILPKEGVMSFLFFQPPEKKTTVKLGTLGSN